MSKSSDYRQDAWTEKQDLKLAEIVLNFKRDGKSLTLAYEEAEKKLKRTKNAISSRWLKVLKPLYEKDYILAVETGREKKKNKQEKTQSKKVSKKKNKPIVPETPQTTETPNTSETFVNLITTHLNDFQQLQKELDKTKQALSSAQQKLSELENNTDEKNKVDKLSREIEELRSENETMQKVMEQVRVQIENKGRRRSYLSDSEEKQDDVEKIG